MSTRCQLVVQGSGVNVYRHCDGYPGTADGATYGVLSDLVPFLKEFKEKRGWDPSYMTARMIQRLANLHSPDDFLSYGLEVGESSFHGDVEYIYSISRKDNDFKLEVYKAEGKVRKLSTSKLLETIII